MKKVLITGSSGYIGSYLLELLNGWQILSVNKSRVSKVGKSLKIDIADKKKLLRIDTKVDVVVHMAAIVGSYDWKLNHITNVIGTENVISLARKLKAKQFIYISSISAKREIKGPYGQTKYEGELLTKKSGLNFTILRPSMVVGRESLGFNRILKNVDRFPGVVPLIGSGAKTRQPVYVKDFVGVIQKVMLNKATYNKAFDVGGAERVQFRELIKLILKIKNQNKLLLPVPVWPVVFAGKFFERTFDPPPFTHEHVLSLTENTAMEIAELEKIINYKPTDLETFVRTVIDEINLNPPNLI